MLASGRIGGALRRQGLGVLLGLALGSAAQAGLGGPVEVPANGVRTSSQAISQSAGATLHTQFLANGVQLRHYVSPAGRVFAVGWEGPVLPDFRTLLGDHFPRYSEAQRQQDRQIHIQSPDLILQAGGMMRAFSGHAYVPALLPPTLSGADIR